MSAPVSSPGVIALRPVAALPDDVRYIAPDSRRAHGTYVKYVLDKCRCDECVEAHRVYNRRRCRTIARPDQIWMPYVPAGRARAHVEYLAANGVGIKTIAKVAGLPHGGLSKLMYGDRTRGMGPSKQIRPTTEAKILAVTIDDAAGGQKIPAGPTWRLLDDLIARGYTKTWLAQRITKNPAAIGLQINRTTVRASTARRVAALHRLIGTRPGPGRRNPWNTRRARTTS